MSLSKLNRKILLLNKYILNKDIIFVYLFSLLLYFPPIWIYFGSNGISTRLQLMMDQAVNPFNIIYNTIDNVLAYRIIVPTFNHFLGLRGFWIILPSLLGAYFLLSFSIKA